MRYGKFVFCGMLICSFFGSLPTFATTYSHDVNVRFTFNSEISVVIDTADIEILDLAPGTSSDSNVVGITISTNNVVGYTASATVGNATYNTTSMVHTNGTDAFTSIAEDASQASLSTDNTWGYTTSLDNGSSWANLSGLPIYTDTAKEIAATNSPASDAIKFKINAKASTSQAAGDYKNVINFTVVANVPPKTIDDVLEEDPDTPTDPDTHRPIIQAITEDVCDEVEAIDEPSLVTDIRDHKDYWVAKLRDGKCWMTQNLDFNIPSTALSSATTDLTQYGIGGYTSTDGYSKNGDTIYWTPMRATLLASSIDSSGYVTGWVEDVDRPSSVDPGDWYSTDTWYDDSNDYNYLAGGAGNRFSTDAYPGNGLHGHVGNYYNWPAAIATNNASSYTSSTYEDYTQNPKNSICPANWQLPVIAQYSNYELGNNDYYNLGYLYNSTYNDEHISESPTWFSRTGWITSGGSQSSAGNYGLYWTSTVANEMSAYDIYFHHWGFNARNYYTKSNGGVVRCVGHTSPKIRIVFNANDGTGTMPIQEVKKYKSVQLANNQFERSGYKFMGWNTKADGTGLGYENAGTYTANVDDSTTTVTMYAQWEADPSGQGGSGYQGRTLARAFEEAYLYNSGNYEGHRGMYVPERDVQGNYTGNYFEATSQSDYEGIPARDLRFAMQDADLEVDGQKVCNRANVAGSEVHLLDLRDNKSYWAVVTKNGKCWMTQNLDLDLSVNKTLTPADTDVTSNWTPPQNTISYTSGTISGWPDDGLGEYGGPAMSVDVGNWYFAGFNYNDRCTNGCDYINGTTDGVFSQTPYKLNGEHGHVGNYYNWHAAHATSESFVRTDTPSETSICPKGWFLPYFRGSSNPEDGDDLVQLVYTYSSTDMNSDVNLVPGPFYLVHAGRITVGRLAEAGVNFQFWSREYGNHYWGYSGYGYMTSNSGIDYIASIQRKSAVTVRCLMR